MEDPTESGCSGHDADSLPQLFVVSATWLTWLAQLVSTLKGDDFITFYKTGQINLYEARRYGLRPTKLWHVMAIFGDVFEDMHRAYHQNSSCGPANSIVDTPNLILTISFDRENHDRQLDGMGCAVWKSLEVQLFKHVGSFWQGIFASVTYLP